MRARPPLLAIAMLVLAPSARAQTPVDEDCNYAVIQRLPWESLDARDRALYPDSAYARMAPRMVAGEWHLLADSIAWAVATDTTISDANRSIFTSQLGHLVEELEGITSSDAPERLRTLGRGPSQARFRISSGPGGDTYDLFAGDQEPIAVGEIRSRAERRALCWRALTLQRMLSAWGSPARRAAIDAMQQSAVRWDNFNERGYSQFPWELVLNSARFSPTSQDPPKSQIVFLHPAVSMELVAPSFDGNDFLRRMDAITIEPLGFLMYNGSRSFYAGLSSLVSLPSDGLVGVGAMAHAGAYGKVGVIFWRAEREGDAEADDRRLVISADLYQAFTDAPARLRAAKARALERIAREKLLEVPHRN